MNSYLYNDEVQIEESEAFRLYETEEEYWEEYDRLQALKGVPTANKTVNLKWSSS